MNPLNIKDNRNTESRVRKELDCIDAILKSWNINHIVAISSIIESIKIQTERSIHQISPPVVRRIQSVYSKVIQLIDWLHGEIEWTFLRIGEDTELLLTAWWIVIFSWDNSQIISCTKNEELFLNLIMKHGNWLPIKEESIAQVKKIIEWLNIKLNIFWIFFSVEDEKLFCSNEMFESPNDEKITQKQDTTSESKESSEEVIHNNILFFWSKQQKSIKLQIFTPVRDWTRRDIRVMIWKSERVFKPFSFQLFLELLSGSKAITTTQAANIAVFNLLKNTQIELIWSVKNSLQLAWRSDSLKHIDYYSWSKKDLPEYTEIENKYITKDENKEDTITEKQTKAIEKYEKISWEIAWITFEVISSQGYGRLRKFKVKIWERSILLSEKQRDLFAKLYQAESESIVISPAEYQIYIRLKTMIPNEYIIFFESKRKKLRKKADTARVMQKIPPVQDKPTEIPPEKKSPIKQDIQLPEVESETEWKILELLSKNEGIFFSYESLAEKLWVEDNNDLRMTFLLIKSKFNKLNGEKIFERKWKGWFLLLDMQSIPDKKEIHFEWVYGRDTCIFSDLYGVFITDTWEVIFQNAEVEAYITLKNWKLFPKSGKYLNRNIEVIRTRFRKFYPGIKVSAKNIWYSESSHLQ